MEIGELVIQAKNGDEAAFSLLYDYFSQKIFRYIRVKIQNRQDAEDLSQIVFYKSYCGLKSLRPGKINFPGWLFKIASNSINDYLRKSYRSPGVVSLNENIDPPDRKSLEREIIAKSDFELAQKAFTKLPPLYREILEQVIIRGRPIDEVAQQHNKSKTSIRLVQCRALKKVRSMLSQFELTHAQ